MIGTIILLFLVFGLMNSVGKLHKENSELREERIMLLEKLLTKEEFIEELKKEIR